MCLHGERELPSLSYSELVETRELRYTDVLYSYRYCCCFRARIHFIKCDLIAWASKPEEACNTPALALKRDLHCAQVPRACLDILQGPIKQVCSFNWATANLAADKMLQSGGLRNVGRKEFVLFWAVIVFILLYMDT